jgi:hypothetical protein
MRGRNQVCFLRKRIGGSIQEETRRVRPRSLTRAAGRGGGGAGGAVPRSRPALSRQMQEVHHRGESMLIVRMFCLGVSGEVWRDGQAVTCGALSIAAFRMTRFGMDTGGHRRGAETPRVITKTARNTERTARHDRGGGNGGPVQAAPGGCLDPIPDGRGRLPTATSATTIGRVACCRLPKPAEIDNHESKIENLRSSCPTP